MDTGAGVVAGVGRRPICIYDFPVNTVIPRQLLHALLYLLHPCSRVLRYFVPDILCCPHVSYGSFDYRAYPSISLVTNTNGMNKK